MLAGFHDGDFTESTETGPRISERIGRHGKAQSWAKRRAGMSARQYTANKWQWLLFCFLRPHSSRRRPPGPPKKCLPSIQPGKLCFHSWISTGGLDLKIPWQKWSLKVNAGRLGPLRIRQDCDWQWEKAKRPIGPSTREELNRLWPSQCGNDVRRDQWEFHPEISQHRGVPILLRTWSKVQGNACDIALITQTRWSLCYFCVCWYER